MQAINAIFDENLFKPLEPVPVEGKYEVVITFTKPIGTKETRRQGILEHFGTWDDEDVETVREIMEERINSSKNRNYV